MNIEQRINNYVKRTKMQSNIRYSLYSKEISPLYEMAKRGNIFDAICLAFSLGQAKGYRMARKEGRA